MSATCQFNVQCFSANTVNSEKQFRPQNGRIYRRYGDWWECISISKMAILCLCGEVYKASVISSCAVFLAYVCINIVERSLYLRWWTVLANNWRNQRKLVWTEQMPSVTHRPNWVWTVLEQTVRAPGPWQLVRTLGKGSQQQCDMTRCWKDNAERQN